ncbi:MAG TPA: hypothetical protein VFG68_09755 [Fimbriiglobus sp.]|nr:hypothetical protein [Fimbriiglobus sp.]
MDKTPHTPRRFRLTPTRGCAAAGLLALTGGLALAQPPGPAARLKPPQVLDEPARTVVGRGAAPEGGATVSVQPPAAPVQPATRPAYGATPTQWGTGPVRTAMPRTMSVPPPREPGLLEGAWMDLKGLITGQPAETAVPFQHPQSQAPTSIQPRPQSVARPVAGGVYAGPPAYRWYGWGTTTPGANQYAPTGQYPRGSASWYSQTGATPGAFPVPVMNPYRPAPTAGPPAYVRGAVADATTAPGVRLSSADARPELRYGPTPIAEPMPVNTVPVPPSPPPAVVERADDPPVIAQSRPATGVVQTSATADDGPTWQRADGDAAPFANPPPTVTVIRGMEPKASEPSPEAVVRAACRGRATVTEVKQTGPTHLVVKVRAATQADARAAFAALSEVPALRPYRVEFEADIK